MSIQPFNRRVELDLFGVPEWQASQEGSQKVLLTGDGTPNGLRIRFDIRKQLPATCSPSTIRIYNLSQGLRQSLQKSQAKVVLRVGWNNTGLQQIFSGSILSATSERDGADIATTITSLSGWGGLSRAQVAKTFSAGISLKEMVKWIAEQIPGVVVDPAWIELKKIQMGKYTYDGFAGDWLDELSRVYAFSWTIIDGKFRAIDDNKAFPAVRTVGTDNGLLLRAEPMLAGITQINYGTTIDALLMPELNVGDSVQLQSKLNPQLNKLYKIYTLGHSGDTHSTQWTTHIESFKVF